MSEKSIKPPSATDNNFHTKIICEYGQGKEKNQRNLLQTRQFIFNSWKCNTFIYCLRTRYIVKRFIHRFLLCNCLLGAVSLINSCDPNIYAYSGNGAEQMHVHNIHGQTVFWVKKLFILGVDYCFLLLFLRFNVDYKKNVIST